MVAQEYKPNYCHYYIMIAKGHHRQEYYIAMLQGKGEASYAVLNHLKGSGI